MAINNAAQLKEAITLLETDVDFKKRILVEHFHDTYESLKPVNLIKNSIHKFTAKPGIVNKLVGVALGTGAGMISTKLLPGKKASFFKRVLNSALQLTLSKVINKRP